MRKCMAIALAFFVFPLVVAKPVQAGDREADQAKFVEKVRVGLTKLGTGPDARVKLTLRDKTKVEGFVSRVSDTNVEVTNAAGVSQTVQFPDVTKVQGNNLRTRWKVVIAASVVAGIIITLIIVKGAFCDGC